MMTNAEIFTQILHEVTGRPKAELAALRQEKSGILNWVLEGAREAISQ
jgi:hypothetical protein